MMLFAYRLREPDRDACAYVDENAALGSHTINGPCFSMQFGHNFASSVPVEYGEVETYLTEAQYCEARDNGYTEEILDALASPEALDFAEDIFAEEREAMMDEFKLEPEDVDMVLDNFSYGYRDRGLICCVYNSWEEAAEELAWSWGYVNNDRDERYFNYDAFADDLRDMSDEFMEISGDRVLKFNL